MLGNFSRFVLIVKKSDVFNFQEIWYLMIFGLLEIVKVTFLKIQLYICLPKNENLFFSGRLLPMKVPIGLYGHIVLRKFHIWVVQTDIFCPKVHIWVVRTPFFLKKVFKYGS